MTMTLSLEKSCSREVKWCLFLFHIGGGFTSNRGTFGNVAKLDTMTCITFGKSADVCYTGGGNGQIYVWNGLTLAKAFKAHDGPCFAMHSLDKVCVKTEYVILTTLLQILYRLI